jgi:hypothetical protein
LKTAGDLRTIAGGRHGFFANHDFAAICSSSAAQDEVLSGIRAVIEELWPQGRIRPSAILRQLIYLAIGFRAKSSATIAPRIQLSLFTTSTFLRDFGLLLLTSVVTVSLMQRTS